MLDRFPVRSQPQEVAWWQLLNAHEGRAPRGIAPGDEELRERGSVEIADRPALERRACECYGVIAGEFRRLLETHRGGYTLGR